MNPTIIAKGGICGALAVILGAFGAHALRDLLSEEQLRVFHTAVEYQFYHSLALIAVGVVYEKFQNRWIRYSGYAFFIGIILFSGSLYLLTAFTSLSYFGIITPIGGLCFIAGWSCLTIGVLKK
jgi:uncharacterized membrane protein YgdD (TMEM256/DUF423 family)